METHVFATSHTGPRTMQGRAHERYTGQNDQRRHGEPDKQGMRSQQSPRPSMGGTTAATTLPQPLVASRNAQHRAMAHALGMFMVQAEHTRKRFVPTGNGHSQVSKGQILKYSLRQGGEVVLVEVSSRVEGTRRAQQRQKRSSGMPRFRSRSPARRCVSLSPL